MVVQRKLIITESDRDYIRGLYGVKNTTSESEIVITDWLSPDEKYAIFLDELYDITNKVKIGNIWENFDNFKIFLKHSFEVAENISTNIKESVLNSINTLVLTESTQNMVHLKPYIKEMFITEGLGDWVNGAGEWLKDEAGKAISGTTEFFTTSLTGIQKMVGNISSGQWSEVINLLKSGALYVARKIRGALYNPIGLILDAILVASGVGKGAQFVVWGIVVALDIYELTTGNYEDKSEGFLERLLFTGIDMIGLVGAGFAAKSSKTLIGNMLRKFGSSEKGLIKAAQSSPKFKSLLETILNSVTSAGSRMGKVNSYLKVKSPMLHKFVSSILSGLGKFIMKIITSIKAILSGTFKVISAPGKAIEKSLGSGSKLGKGAKAGVNTTALVGGLGTYQKVDSNNKNKEINNILGGDVKPEFDGI
jgi:hypothetical protein